MGNDSKQRLKRADMNCYVGPVNNWKSLGIAIVRQAVLDWHESSAALRKPATASHEMLELKRDAEHFLNSPWCEFYSGLDGKTILRKLKEGLI